jgi:tight adherence protein B
LSDVEIFVTAIDIQYRTGGNLSTILRTIAHTVRERLRIRGEIRVMTTQQRISAWILSALPLVIFLAMKFMNPNYADKVLQPGVMRWLVLGAALSVSGGFYILNRIANIEV